MLFSTKSYYRGRVGITPVHAPFDIAEQTYDKTTETITLSAGFGFTASLYKVKQESIQDKPPVPLSAIRWNSLEPCGWVVPISTRRINPGPTD